MTLRKPRQKRAGRYVPRILAYAPTATAGSRRASRSATLMRLGYARPAAAVPPDATSGVSPSAANTPSNRAAWACPCAVAPASTYLRAWATSRLPIRLVCASNPTANRCTGFTPPT
jgi:hypothetical protein